MELYSMWFFSSEWKWLLSLRIMSSRLIAHVFWYILFICLFCFFFWDRVSLCRPGWSAVVQSWLTATSASRHQVFSASASWVARIIGTCHHAQLIFVFLVETGFHHVGQAGLELLTLWSTCLGLPEHWDYRCEPPAPGPVLCFTPT